jgi:hypothetical protein
MYSQVVQSQPGNTKGVPKTRYSGGDAGCARNLATRGSCSTTESVEVTKDLEIDPSKWLELSLWGIR